MKKRDSFLVGEFGPTEILVDTREQTPWTFENVVFHRKRTTFPTRRTTLKTGDYSLPGLENFAAVERKSVADFLQSIARERGRFRREIERLAEMNVKCVVVEGRFETTLLTAATREFTIDTVVGTVASWTSRYGVPFVFCSDVKNAQFVALHWLNQAERRWEELGNEKKETEAPF